MNINTESLKKIIENCFEHSDIELVLLFGSHALGNAHSRSDVDIGVARNKKLTIDEILDLKQRLSKALSSDDVDIIDLNAVSGTILKEALTKSLVIKNKRPALYAQIMRRMWYNQADEMRYFKRILQWRREKWLKSKETSLTKS